VPEVIAFDPSLENSLHCPYILMGFIEGKALGEVWHDKVSALSDVEERRSTNPKDIAKAILQLNKFTFTEGGRPEYSNGGRLMRIGAARQFDMHAIMEGTDQDKDTESLPWAYSGPFKDQFSYLLSLRNKKCQRPSDGAWEQGMDKLLRLFASWIPFDGLDDGINVPVSKHPFLLAHPDFDLRNILVDPATGHMTALVDWDNVCAVPRAQGNTCYPRWLTRDWDVTHYARQKNHGDTPANEIPPSDSPAELQNLRDQCEVLLQEAYEEIGGKGNIKRACRNTLMIDNLETAADDPCAHPYIMKTIMQKIKGVVWEEDLDDRVHLYDVAMNLAEGDLDEDVLCLLKKGFKHCYRMRE